MDRGVVVLTEIVLERLQPAHERLSRPFGSRLRNTRADTAAAWRPCGGRGPARRGVGPDQAAALDQLAWAERCACARPSRAADRVDARAPVGGLGSRTMSPRVHQLGGLGRSQRRDNVSCASHAPLEQDMHRLERGTTWSERSGVSVPVDEVDVEVACRAREVAEPAEALFGGSTIAAGTPSCPGEHRARPSHRDTQVVEELGIDDRRCPASSPRWCRRARRARRGTRRSRASWDRAARSAIRDAGKIDTRSPCGNREHVSVQPFQSDPLEHVACPFGTLHILPAAHRSRASAAGRSIV